MKVEASEVVVTTTLVTVEMNLTEANELLRVVEDCYGIFDSHTAMLGMVRTQLRKALKL